jgi:hypothetical protein
MFDFGLDLGQFIPLLPSVAAVFSSKITELTKQAVESVGSSLPRILKPTINVVAAAVLAGLCGEATADAGAANALVGGLIGVASSLGFAQGKKS